MHIRFSITVLKKFTFVLMTAVLSGCGIISLPQNHQPVEFTQEPVASSGSGFQNWPAPPHVVEGIIKEAISSGNVPNRVDPQNAQRTAHGVSGPNEIVVYFPELQKEVKFKWKDSPAGDLDNFNNSVARELASYQIQKLFLDPEDYVVPTSLAFCVTLQHHSELMGLDYNPQIPGSDCVVGNASLWMQNVTVPEVFYEESRFLSEPGYAYYFSNFNILTYLIAHRDARTANLLISDNEKRRQVFLIDNGTTFGAFPYNFFATNWNIIRVPALRKETIERLRRVKREDLDRLGVVAQLNRENDRVFRNVAPGKNLDPEKPVRIRKEIVQFGLTRKQIDDVWERLQKLIEKVDNGKIPVF